MTPDAPPDRLELLGFPLDPVTLTGALARMEAFLDSPTAQGYTVVTLNPEIIVQAQTHPEFARAVGRADLVTADGVGVTWAAGRLLGHTVPRAPGVDLMGALLARNPGVPAYFLGGKPGVAEAAATVARERYGSAVVGFRDGYFAPQDDAAVAAAVRESGARMVFTGMGAGRQELFNEAQRAAMGGPLLLGIGGALDVLSGTAALAPEWTRRAGLEWAWRVGLQPARWRRAPRLLQFVRLVRAAGGKSERS